MAKLKFNSTGVTGARRYATSAKNTSGTVKDGISAVQKNMQSCISGRNNISTRLTNAQKSLSQIEKDIQAIYQTVDSASTKYQNTEAHVVRLGQAVAQTYKVSSKNGKNKGAFAPIIAGKTNNKSYLKKKYNSNSRLNLMQEAAKVKWGSKNNITQKYNPTSKYFNIPQTGKYTPSKYDLSKGIFGSKGLIDPILQPSKYEGRFNNVNQKLHPTTGNAQATTADKSNGNFDWKLADLASGIIGSAGTGGKSVGGIISTTSDIYSGYKEGKMSDTWKGILGIGDTFVSNVGDLAENGFKADADWKETLIGNWKKGSAVTEIAEKTAKYADDSTISALFKSEMDGFIPSSAKNVGENIKVGAQWFGAAVSLATNGIDNYSDYDEGKMSAGRAVAETISETVVDIAIGTGATVAVGAAAVALGVSAPAVAVGAVAAGAVWVADTGVRWATSTFGKEEKGLTEAVSDVILDVGEAVIDSGKEIINDGIDTVKGIGKAFSNVGQAIDVKWRECFG